jgi:hypothetical protein
MSYLSIYVCLFVRRPSVCLSTYLWHYSPCGPWSLLQFLTLYTVGRIPWTGISQSQGRCLHTEQHKHRINAQGHSCIKLDSNPWSQCSRGHCDRLPLLLNEEYFSNIDPMFPFRANLLFYRYWGDRRRETDQHTHLWFREWISKTRRGSEIFSNTKQSRQFRAMHRAHSYTQAYFPEAAVVLLMKHVLQNWLAVGDIIGVFSARISAGPSVILIIVFRSFPRYLQANVGIVL